MPTQTPKLGLPEFSASQSQPELIINPTTRALEQLAGIASVIDSLTAPPGGSPGPADGDAYIVTATATGDWTGHEHDIAYLQNGDWLFLTPLPGWLAYDQSVPGFLKFVGGVWASASI